MISELTNFRCRHFMLQIRRDEETGKILNLVFVWADERTDLKVDVPVVFKGEDACPGVRKGELLNLFCSSIV